MRCFGNTGSLWLGCDVFAASLVPAPRSADILSRKVAAKPRNEIRPWGFALTFSCEELFSSPFLVKIAKCSKAVMTACSTITAVILGQYPAPTPTDSSQAYSRQPSSDARSSLSFPLCVTEHACNDVVRGIGTGLFACPPIITEDRDFESDAGVTERETAAGEYETGEESRTNTSSRRWRAVCV